MSGPLVFLSPGFPAHESDTTCLPAQQSLIREINRLFPGHELIIISFQYPYTSHPYQWNGNQVFPINGRNRGGLKRIFTWLKVWRVLQRLHRQKKITGLFSFWLGEAAFTGHYFSRIIGCRHFTWLLGQDALPGNKYAKYIPPCAEQLAAMSDFLADEFFKNYGTRPAHIITHGIEPAVFPKSIMKKDIDIIGAGSLIPLKQYAVFISVIAELKTSIPRLSVKLCGDGPEMQKLQSLITKHHLEQTIVLTGELPHEELMRLMQRSKILMHTSSYEGFGGVCIEALYAGAHVISFTKPMHTWIRNWHIAEDAKDMTGIAARLLQTPNLKHTTVMPYKMEDAARAVVALFD